MIARPSPRSARCSAVTVVDADVDLFDAVDVEWGSPRASTPRPTGRAAATEGHILNPVVKIDPDGKGGTVTKIGIDAMGPARRRFAFSARALLGRGSGTVRHPG